MAMKNLLVELFVEELPPKALKKLGESFASTLTATLKSRGLLADAAVVTPFASPRRLAAHVTGVAAKAADKPLLQKLMPVAVALDAAGQATPALLKKLGALGKDASVVPTLKRQMDGKSETLFLDTVVPGATLAEGLQAALEAALAGLPIPKVMTYQLADGWNSVNFVRPAHRLVALHGADVVPVSVLGLQAGRETQGHRFEGSVDVVAIRDADSYAEQMEREGAVIPGFAARREEIERQLKAAAGKEGLQPIDDDALLDEVTALVERPNVLVCQFDREFLDVPQECLILTMKANQKYFPLLDAAGKLTNKFLVVSNIRPEDASAVIGGNERVVRPRLADAKFFFDQDRKTRLADRVGKLDRIVYHNKLGTLGERVRRLVRLAESIAHHLNADVAHAGRAALLAKADLVTDMVGEFPELQGIMGRYYAAHDGEAAVVADAIEAHYRPRFNGDALPRGNVACAVALADKLDALVGFFGIGQVPTGDKDPFGLRRAALGVLRMLMETPLPLDVAELIDVAAAGFPAGVLAGDFKAQLLEFMRERLRHLLREEGHEGKIVDAVLALDPTRIDKVPAKLAAARDFVAMPEAEALAAANKRIVNILKKAEGAIPAEADVALLQEAAEKALFERVNGIAPAIHSFVANEDYADALKALAALKTEVDAFFDGVMVMTEEPLTRANRLALLKQLAALMNQVADISKLSA